MYPKNNISGNIIHVTVNNFLQPFPNKPKTTAKELVIPDKNMINNLLSLSRHFNEKSSIKPNIPKDREINQNFQIEKPNSKPVPYKPIHIKYKI